MTSASRFPPQLLGALVIAYSLSLGAQELTNASQFIGATTPLSAPAILASMKKVADWQLTNPSPSVARYKENGWTYGAFYVGVMALDSIAGTPKYHDAMVAVGKKFNWNPAPRGYFADDQCVGQMYLELYLKDHDPAMLQPIKEKLDYILAHPSSDSLDYKKKGKADRYWWCDSLFMGPPTWALLYQATGDKKYLDFMDKEWWLASDFLYDTNEHLFYRDSRYFTQKEANGKKVFWSRGNGWVLAGLARVLEMMPQDYPSRPRYEKQFKEMAERIASLQQPDGLWHASLLDPTSYPMKETSGSGFYTFALAWGINHGLLDRSKYEPVARKAWIALGGCVTPEGKLGYVQQVGSDPKSFKAEDTEVYGTGAFLLAGKEIYTLYTPQASEAGKDSALISSLLFFPEKYPAGNWTPRDLRYRDVWFKAEDGHRLHGWLCKADPERATIFFAHGNGGNIATRVPWLTYLQSKLKVNVFIFDYRGYGRSEGVPSVDGVLEDARAARQALREVLGGDTNVFLMGESLGGAIVVQLAAESPPRGLILQSTFTSLKDMAEAHYPLLASIVPTNTLNSGLLVPSIHCPLLQSHGTIDATIPFANGAKLFALANEPKDFVRLEGVGHNNWMTTEYLRRLDLFISKVATPSGELTKP